jgi:acyl carrier protein
MSDKSISERVINVFAQFKKTEPENIKMDTTFEELGFDSLDGLNLIFELEEEFDITVPDDKVQSMRSVREVIEGIESLLAAKTDAAGPSA